MGDIKKNRYVYILESIIGVKYLLKRINIDFKHRDKIIEHVLFKAISKIIRENSILNIEVSNLDYELDYESSIDLYNTSIEIESIIYKVSRILEMENTLILNDIDSYFITLKIINTTSLRIEIETATEEDINAFNKKRQNSSNGHR